jgi:hypothetical protein
MKYHFFQKCITIGILQSSIDILECNTRCKLDVTSTFSLFPPRPLVVDYYSYDRMNFGQSMPNLGEKYEQTVIVNLKGPEHCKQKVKNFRS